MTTKDDYYRFLKSAKEKRCGGLSGISHLTKNEMALMASKLGFSPLDNARKVYTARNDPTLKEGKIEIKGRKATRKRGERQQEEKKEETWEEMKERGKKLRDEANKIIEKLHKKQESTERDLTNSKEYKNAQENIMKSLRIMDDAEALRRQVLGLPTREEERKQKIEEARKRKEEREKKEKEKQEAREKKEKEKKRKEKEKKRKEEKKVTSKNNGKPKRQDRQDKLLEFFGKKKK